MPELHGSKFCLVDPIQPEPDLLFPCLCSLYARLILPVSNAAIYLAYKYKLYQFLFAVLFV